MFQGHEYTVYMSYVQLYMELIQVEAWPAGGAWAGSRVVFVCCCCCMCARDHVCVVWCAVVCCVHAVVSGLPLIAWPLPLLRHPPTPACCSCPRPPTSAQDLLRSESENLQIRENEGGVFVSGVHQQEVQNITQCLHLLHLGDRNRPTAFTALNAHSSRSHAVIMLTVIKRRSVSGTGEAKIQRVKVGWLP